MCVLAMSRCCRKGSVLVVRIFPEDSNQVFFGRCLDLSQVRSNYKVTGSVIFPAICSHFRARRVTVAYLTSAGVNVCCFLVLLSRLFSQSCPSALVSLALQSRKTLRTITSKHCQSADLDLHVFYCANIQLWCFFSAGSLPLSLCGAFFPEGSTMPNHNQHFLVDYARLPTI